MKHFKDKEFSCKCGCKLNCNEYFKNMLDLAREYADVPFIITSGARCEEHNKNVGGVENSSHIKGLAADIAFKTNLDLFKILHGLSRARFRRIGVNMKKKFVHTDIDDIKKEVIWEY